MSLSKLYRLAEAWPDLDWAADMEKPDGFVSNICPKCKVEVAGYEYPAHEDQEVDDWNLCPTCGTELPHARGEMVQAYFDEYGGDLDPL